MTSEQRNAVLSEAITWIGTPFVMNACVKGAGVDCSRFVYACYKSAGMDIPGGFQHLPVDWALHTREEKLLEILDTRLERAHLPLPGDLAVFRFGRAFSHAALVLDWPKVIQVPDMGKCQYSSYDQPPLMGRPVLFFRPR